MIRPEANCRHCKNRTAECHAECESFAEYKIKLAEYNSVISRKKSADADYRSTKVDVMAMTNKRIHHR